MSEKFTLEDGRFLVSFARRSIEEFLRSGKRLELPADVPDRLLEKCGVFVTLSNVSTGEKALRGCIGFPEPVYPLIMAVRDSAINSAVNDPRFPPVTLEEMDEIVVEVSILTPPQLIEVADPREYPSRIEVGRDGLIVERGWNKGLLLPQVAVEWRWDAEEFLTNCCLKAGLVPDAWLLPGTKVYKFQAIIFEEEKPRGEVRRRELC